MRLLILSCLLALTSADQLCNSTSDFIFIMDGSGSIAKEDFDLMVDFASSAVDGLQIDDGSGTGARIGLLVFNDRNHLQFHLDAYTDKNALLAAIDALKLSMFPISSTHTDAAISYARRIMFSIARPDAHRVMVVLTDGVSIFPSDTLDQAQRAQQEGIEMVSIGIGSGVYMDEINAIASSPRNVLTPTNFYQLHHYVSAFSVIFCVGCPSISDIVFVIDYSGRFEQGEFHLMINFILGAVAGLQIEDGSGTGARVGVVLYEDKNYVQIHLDAYTDKNTLLGAIDVIRQRMLLVGVSPTDNPISFARSDMLSLARPGVPKVIVLVTKYPTDNPSSTLNEAHLAKQDGITVVLVDINTGIDVSEIHGVASSPDHVLTTDDFNQLDAIVRNLAQAGGFCDTEDCSFIDPGMETCCCGTIQAGNDTYCCGGSGMDPATEICCNNLVIFVGDANDYTCCGDSAISISQELCCDGVVHSATNIVAGYHADMECCGDQSFDPESQVCCEGNVQQGDCCCDAVGFNSATHHCCNGQVVTWGEHYDCCGQVSYDQENEACCGNGVVVAKVQNRNCNGYNYIKRKEMCCCGVINSGREATWECCGTVSYQMGEDLCCEGNVLIYGFPGDKYDCCGVQPYKPTKESCCDGQVAQGEKIDGVTACCGTELYEIGKQLCCDDNVHAIHSSYVTRCCGTNIFYPEYQVCCEDSVHSGTSLMCCGSEAYDPAVESCCSDGNIVATH